MRIPMLLPTPRMCRQEPGDFRLQELSARAAPVTLSLPSIAHKLAALGIETEADPTLPQNAVVIGRPADPAPVVRRPEGYGLRIDQHGVALRGADVDGLFWGLVTLEQSLRGGRMAPCAVIRDWPAFPFRCHHDDISRKQVSTVADFRRIVRLLSSYKIRYYTPYMEDMLFLPSHPDIGLGRGRLLPAEVGEILAEARLHNVTVFPTFSLIGHQENLLANPRYRRYAREVFQPPSSFDPAKPALRPFLRQVIADVCALFPDAPYFHACFDETQGVPEEVLIAHANWCAAELARRGKRMLMWVDMFKNHFGLAKLHALSDNIIPVEWEYGDPRPMVPRYLQARAAPLGLAGYGNCCNHLSDFRTGKTNIDQWIGVARRLHSPGFGASQWGDNGYENSRDLCWNLFAYSAEAAWTGNPAHGRDFERRFQTTFYGRPLDPLRQVIERLSPRRRLGPGENWRLFRENFSSLVRRVRAEPGLARRAAHDLALHARMLRAVADARRQAVREVAHLDHFTVAIERQRLLCARLLLAARCADDTAVRPRAALAAHIGDMHRVRDRFRSVWLRHNKRPNIEVSLAVYRQVERSIRDFLRPAIRSSTRHRCLDLGVQWDQYTPVVGGIPLGMARVNGTPFRFAGPARTHALVAGGATLALPFAPQRVADIHLVYGGQHIHADAHDIHPMLEVRLLCGDSEVFRERLQAIRHICDWWAPRGEHMWAGGGLRHADPRRVSFALLPGFLHGLLHLRGFRTRGVRADRLELRSLAAPGSREAVAVFAITLEKQEPSVSRRNP